jgi:hypothetical protein
LGYLMAERGIPAFLRSGSEPEFIEETIQNHLNALDAETRSIKPGAP